MASSVYVAGSVQDIERVREVQNIVRKFGHSIVFDWTGPNGEIRTDGSWDSARELGAKIATIEINACRRAELVIVLSPPLHLGLGCWIEMGAALASGAEVWVIDPQRDSVFWQHPAVTRFKTISNIMWEFKIKESEEGLV